MPLIYQRLALAVLLSAPVPVALAADDRDPLESWNRGVFAFNDRVDRYFLKPLAKGYRAITPQAVDDGVTNFMSNLGEPSTALNAALQGKFKQSLADTGRFIFNTTFGLAGIFDVASSMELPRHEEDFGQTFAKWGAPAGPYVVVPFMTGMTLRDGAGMGTNAVFVLKWRNEPLDIGWETELGILALSIVDARADIIPMEESMTAGDRYRLLRDAYFQRREFLINDGAVTSDPFLDDDFDDDGDEAMEPGATEPVPESAPSEGAAEAP